MGDPTRWPLRRRVDPTRLCTNCHAPGLLRYPGLLLANLAVRQINNSSDNGNTVRSIAENTPSHVTIHCTADQTVTFLQVLGSLGHCNMHTVCPYPYMCTYTYTA